jgi:HEAT repeats/Putative zinc-finger
MTCEDVRKSLALMLYGEISFDDEEAVHTHLESCAECRLRLDRERSMHRALDERELDVSPFLLRECRQTLQASLAAEPARHGLLARFWYELRQIFELPWMPRFARPAGAVALVALGFFGARVMPMLTQAGVNTASMLSPSNARVRYVQPGPDGQVQLVVDEMRQRVISGNVDDQRIRAFLLEAAKDPTDPGLRVESVDLLKSQLASDDVRGALLAALQHDPNAGVRLKALDGLRPYAAQADVRQALAHVLLTDNNPGLRTQAIDLLTKNSPEQQLVGILQELMHKEDNSYIRFRCQKALHQMNASVETY